MKKVYELWQENNVPFFDKSIRQKTPAVAAYTLDAKKPVPCVIVCPGGAYSGLADDHEGKQICKFLNKNGIAGFILRYRVAPYHYPCQELDVKRAVRFVRANSEKFNVDPNRIGMMGFSAGGHLACMAGMRFDYGIDGGDEVDRFSSRPDSVCTCYAVASLDKEITHRDTRENLLGDYDNDELADKLTCENAVPDDVPPFFIWHTAADNCVDARCSLRLANALAEKKKTFELHIFPYGDHGLGLAKSTPLACVWSDLYIKWLGELK